MAVTIISSEQPDTPSLVNVGEPITRRVTLAIGERTEQGLIALVNERRAVLRERVPKDTPVVGPVENVEDALMDLIGGVGAAGGSSWFYQNFAPQQRSFGLDEQNDEGLTESTVVVFHHHNPQFRSTDVYIGWKTDADHIQTLWHVKTTPTRRGFGSSMKPIPFMFAVNSYDVVGEITGRSNELVEANRRLPTPTTGQMFKEARLKYERDMAEAYRSEFPIGVLVEHPPGVLFHVVHTGNEGQKVAETLG